MQRDSQTENDQPASLQPLVRAQSVCIRATTQKDAIAVLCAYGCGMITEEEAEILLPGANGAFRCAVERGVEMAAVNTLARLSDKATTYKQSQEK